MTLLAVGFRFARTASRPAVQARGITSKAFRQPRNKPAPYDWKNKPYRLWRSLLLDKTTSRFDENTKLVLVEGPVASGKTAFAKELADQLDMLHMEDVTMDMLYINSYGYDIRQLDDRMPDSLKSFDETNFNKDPFHMNVAGFQAWMYKLRYSRYIDALAHILSTGQGVVLERSPYTDLVFSDTMAKHNYISKGALFTMNELKRATFSVLMRPHLVIYLDVPVPKVQENIKKRNKYGEAAGKALTTKYLEDMEDNYKTKYLPMISEHAELMMYDWSEPGEVEIVVEDIERIDFDKYTKHDKRMRDWDTKIEKNWAEYRMTFADEKFKLLSRLNVPILDAPEMWASGQDWEQFIKVYKTAPGNEYAFGFDPTRETGLLFKAKGTKYFLF